MSSPADFSLDYTAGLLAPDSSVIGLLPFVDDVGTSFRYGRTATPTARAFDGAPLGQDAIDVVGSISRFQATNTAPHNLRSIEIPGGAVGTIYVEVHVRQTGAQAHYWKRFDFENVHGSTTADHLNQLGSTIDEKTEIDEIGLGTPISVAIAGDVVIVQFTGINDTVEVLAVVKAEVYHLGAKVIEEV